MIRLKLGLSGATTDQGTEKRPTVTEVAERIKALKAANTVDAMPARVSNRSFSAEEPITARIRRRVDPLASREDGLPDRSPVPEGSPSSPVTDAPAVEALLAAADEPSTYISPATRKTTYEDRIATSRQRTDHKPGMA